MKMKRSIAFGLFLFFPALSDAKPAFTTAVGSLPVCNELLRNLNETGNINSAVKVTGFKVVPFQRSEISIQFSAENPNYENENVEVAQADINNDGKLDLLIKYETWFHQRPGDILWIIPDTHVNDLDKIPPISASNFKGMPSVESAPPWPYTKHDIMFVSLAVLTYNNVTYLSMRDTLLGDPGFLDRKWVIAKYNGKKHVPGAYHETTDEIDVVCSFSMQHL